MRSHDIRRIRAEETRLLRHQLLRPHQLPEQLVYPGDNHPLSFHAGAFDRNNLVGIASVAPEVCPVLPNANAWRLRGMATLPAVQRQGYGAALVQACIAYVQSQGATLLWCHGRSSALPFYHALGFLTHGDEFMAPDTGPHYLCVRMIGVGTETDSRRIMEES
ncbi:MAG TPA: GNAT family N-acetyltransferase [Roseiflexaceae bacterium]|nr:GNAT family N-acetyltransferase [Roseiflexaceae bacterium]